MDVLALTPARVIIGVGYCGRLSYEIDCGDLIIPKGAFIDEGTSRQYGNTSSQSQADGKLVEKIQDVCDRLSIKHHVGLVWSTDGTLREHEKKIASYDNKGAIGVDMESSAAFTVGEHFRRQTASILVGSDNPLKREGASLERLRDGYSKAVQVALETAISV